MRIFGPLAVLFAIGASMFYFYDLRQQYLNTPAKGENYPAPLLSALSQARAEHKNVVVMVTTSWCGPCQYMKKEVLPSAPVQAQAGKFVWVFLDGDDPANDPFKREFGANSYPSFFILNENGRQLSSKFHGASPEDFASKLAAY